MPCIIFWYLGNFLDENQLIRQKHCEKAELLAVEATDLSPVPGRTEAVTIEVADLFETHRWLPFKIVIITDEP